MNITAARRWSLGMCTGVAAWLALGVTGAQAQAPPLTSPAASLPVAYALEISAPRSLKPLLQQHLDLARFQTAAQDAGITEGELARLVTATPAQARALLETEGYFNAQIKANISRPGGAEPPRVRVQVEAGPQATVASLEVEVQGALQTALIQENNEALDALRELHRSWALPVGAGFAQGAWANAKAKALTQLRTLGYPAATWAQTQASVDATRQAVSLRLVLDSGPLYLFGPVQVEGLSRFDARSVQALQPFVTGTTYNDQLLLDYQERLRKLGLFETVAVELDTAPATASAAPVRVRVREQDVQQATVGVGYSDKAGPRISLEHVNRQVFGSRWVAKNKFEIGRDQQSWQGELLSYPRDNGYRHLIAGNYETESAAGSTVRSSRLRVGRSLDTENLERLVFLEALTARPEADATLPAPSLNINSTHHALSGNVHWLRRTLDNALLPTDGESANLQLGAGYALGGEAARDGFFTRGLARLTAYRPLGSSWYGSARVEVGQVFTGDQVGIPDPLLFRAGGDESVRGYGYRSLGPQESGVVRSARVLFTSSLEVAHPLSQRWPAVWGATFIDAGQAADRWHHLDPVLGYGVGLRWRSPVGPLRIDLAYGEAVRKARLHVSLGVNF